MRHLLLVGLIGVLALSAGPSAQAGLNGDWAMTFNTPMGALDASATMKVDGNKLSGTMSSQAGEVQFTGTVKGATFTINFDVQTANGTFSITMNGEQSGDELKGTFDFGQGMGDWTGKRKS
jgi:hypothetical protein